MNAIIPLTLVAVYYGTLLIVTNQGGAWGSDASNYLANLNYYAYDIPRIEWMDRPRPILAPGLLLYPFTALTDYLTGVRIFVFFCIMSMTGASYYLCRSLMSAKMSAIATVLIVVNPWTAEAVAGGPHTPLGVAILLLQLKAVVDYASGRSINVPVTVAALALLPQVNQAVTGVALLIYLVIIPLAVYYRREVPKSVWIAVILGGGLSLLALTTYVQLLEQPEVRNYAGRTWIGMSGVSNWGLIVGQYGIDMPDIILASMWVLVGLFGFRSKDVGVRILAAALIVLSFIIMVRIADDALGNLRLRSLILAGSIYTPILVLLLQKYYKVLFVLLPVMTAFGFYITYSHLGHDAWTVDTKTAIEYIDERIEPDELVVARASATARYIYSMYNIQTVAGISYVPDWAYQAHRQSYVDTYCILGWASDICDEGEAVERRRARYILEDRRDLIKAESRSQAECLLEQTTELPYTSDPLYFGSVIIWEIDRELATDVVMENCS